MFLKIIEQKTHTPLIADEVWEEAKRVTYSKYEESASLHYLKRCVDLFEQASKMKYHTDFKEYVFELSVEDFCGVAGADVVVSTIHKSKGREFGDVYMLIAEPPNIQDDVLRRYYVGVTRANSGYSFIPTVRCSTECL